MNFNPLDFIALYALIGLLIAVGMLIIDGGRIIDSLQMLASADGVEIGRSEAVIIITIGFAIAWPLLITGAK